MELFYLLIKIITAPIYCSLEVVRKFWEEKGKIKTFSNKMLLNQFLSPTTRHFTCDLHDVEN